MESKINVTIRYTIYIRIFLLQITRFHERGILKIVWEYLKNFGGKLNKYINLNIIYSDPTCTHKCFISFTFFPPPNWCYIILDWTDFYKFELVFNISQLGIVQHHEASYSSYSDSFILIYEASYPSSPCALRIKGNQGEIRRSWLE